MLSFLKLQDSQTTLQAFNEYSALTYKTIASNFEKNTRTLGSVQKDLDVIFRKIREMKRTINTHFPGSVVETEEPEEEDE